MEQARQFTSSQLRSLSPSLSTLSPFFGVGKSALSTGGISGCRSEIRNLTQSRRWRVIKFKMTIGSTLLGEGDGITHSLTLYLEKMMGWKGLVFEGDTT